MKVHGECHCGNVAYDAEVDPERVTICHCSDCQRLTGTAYRVSVPTRISEFVLLRGSPATYVKTADSGAARGQVFCPQCGSPLYSHAMPDAVTYGLRVGCLDERHALPPRKRIWCRSALAWSIDIGELPGRECE